MATAREGRNIHPDVSLLFVRPAVRLQMEA
jgi:hypothetical protein